MISSHRSVLFWTAHSRGRLRNPLRSAVVRCCGGSSSFGDGVGEGLFVGALLCG